MSSHKERGEADVQAPSYFIRTNRNGRAEECRKEWYKMWPLPYPYENKADNKVYNHETGEGVTHEL